MTRRAVLAMCAIVTSGCNNRVPFDGESGTGTGPGTGTTTDTTTGTTDGTGTAGTSAATGTEGTSTGSGGSTGSAFIVDPDGGGSCIVAGPGFLSCWRGQL